MLQHLPELHFIVVARHVDDVLVYLVFENDVPEIHAVFVFFEIYLTFWEGFGKLGLNPVFEIGEF